MVDVASGFEAESFEGDGASGVSSGAGRVAAFSSIAVIGLGLIGASMAAAVKAAYPETIVIGVDVDDRTRLRAMELGWFDHALRPDDERFSTFLADSCELVVVATPVAAVDEYFGLLRDVGYTGVVTDTISTEVSHSRGRRGAAARAAQLRSRASYRDESERNGIDGARPDLFKGANWILCPDEQTVPEHFQMLHELIIGIGARVVSLRREEHDSSVAVVSHVPHVVASSLVHLAMHHADESRALMRLAAGGFKDTTRIAAGSSKLWCGIAFDNAQALSAGLDEMAGIIGSFSDALAAGDRDAFTALLEEAASARRALPAAWVPSTDRLLEVRIPMVDRTGVVAEVTTIASSVGCNIQSIEIDHISESNAVLSLVLTDEGDIGKLSCQLINAGFSVSFCPLGPKEHAHVE